MTTATAAYGMIAYIPHMSKLPRRSTLHKSESCGGLYYHAETANRVGQVLGSQRDTSAVLQVAFHDLPHFQAGFSMRASRPGPTPIHVHGTPHNSSTR